MNKIIQTSVVALAVSLLLSASLVPYAKGVTETTEDTWTTLKPIPTPRRELRVAVVAGKIYAIGGYNSSGTLRTNEIYDPATDTWTPKAPMPSSRRSFGIAVYENKIYVIGGYLSNESRTGLNQVYDTLTDTWENKTPMPTPRSDFCATVVNDKIYVIGGFQYYGYPEYAPSDLNEVYDPKTDTWTTKESIPFTQVAEYASVVVDNKIYVLGGTGGLFRALWRTYNYIYNTEDDAWSKGEPVPCGFIGASAGATTGVFAPKRIYVFGGSIDYSATPCNLTQIYDPEKNVWSNGSSMPTPHARFGVAVVNDELYAISGSYENFQPPTGANEKYTPLGYIPEFASWTPILITLVVIAVTLGIYRRRLAKI